MIGFSLGLQRPYLESRRELERALELDPNDVSSNFWMATVLVNTGYLQQGATRLDQLLQIDPLLPNALHHRGRLLEWMGDLDGARDLMERARAVGARNVENSLAFVSQRQDRPAEAFAELSAGIQFFSAGLPDDTGTVLAKGFLGDAASRAAALGRLREIVESQPKIVPGIVAWGLVVMGEGDEALRVIALSPTSSAIWNSALWSPRGQSVRAAPEFPDFARRVGLVEVWDQHGPPDMCKKDDEGDCVCQ